MFFDDERPDPSPSNIRHLDIGNHQIGPVSATQLVKVAVTHMSEARRDFLESFAHIRPCSTTNFPWLRLAVLPIYSEMEIDDRDAGGGSLPIAEGLSTQEAQR